MSKYLDHTERIASYLDGQMTPGQMQEFEKQLHTDPLLRSEFELQQDIIHSLKDFRKSQLKTRLDQVPVSVGPNGLIGIKAAAAIVISGIVGLGAYLYLNDTTEPVLTDTIEPVEQVIENQQPAVQVEEQIPESTPENIEEAASLTEPSSEASQPEETSPVVEEETVGTNNIVEVAQSDNISNVEEEVPEEAPQIPVINSPKVITPDFEETDLEESFDTPTPSISQEGLKDNTVVEVETAKRDREMFHYQYYSGKLYLYGDFREQPYEILELNSSTGKRLFIYYNGDYYRISDNQVEITPLLKLSDQDIIRKLEIIQANK